MTASPNYPTTIGSYQPLFATSARTNEAFVTKLSAKGDRLIYSTFVRSSRGSEAFVGVSIDDVDAAIVVGVAEMKYPVTPGAFQPVYAGGSDAVMTSLDLLPTGASTFGASSPGCTGPLPIGIDAMPLVGTTFAVTCGNAPASGFGAAYFGAQAATAPIRVAGVDFWVDPAGAWTLAVPIQSDARGAADFSVRVPSRAGLVGTSFVAQFVWLASTIGPQCPASGVSASNGLAMTIQ